MTFLAGFGVVTSLVVGLLTPDRSWSTTAFLAVAIVIAGVITAAAAAQRDRLMRQLMVAASVDALTGCLTRGVFQERLVHESMLAQRHGGIFSVVVADLDDLKALNDANGHHCGHRALRLLASVLRQAARETDVVGRLGGDEFPWPLHETDQEAALAVATRLLGALDDLARARTGSRPVSGSARGWGRTTGLPPAPHRADEALYVAKRSGRNQAVPWEQAVSESQAGLQWLGRRGRRAEGGRRGQDPAGVVRHLPGVAVGVDEIPSSRPICNDGKAVKALFLHFNGQGRLMGCIFGEFVPGCGCRVSPITRRRKSLRGLLP